MNIRRSALACLAGAIGAPLVLAAAPIAAADTTDTVPPVSVLAPTHPLPVLGTAPGSELAPYPSGPDPYVTFGTNPYVPFGVETAF